MAKHRPVPPENISAVEFFTRWVPEVVASDAERRAKLAKTDETIVFTFTESHQSFTVKIDHGIVRGEAGDADDPDLRVELDHETWRGLNRGGLSAPEALLRRRVRIRGDFVLALKLHLLVG